MFQNYSQFSLKPKWATFWFSGRYNVLRKISFAKLRDPKFFYDMFQNYSQFSLKPKWATFWFSGRYNVLRKMIAVVTKIMAT